MHNWSAPRIFLIKNYNFTYSQSRNNKIKWADLNHLISNHNHNNFLRGFYFLYIYKKKKYKFFYGYKTH